MSNIYIAYGSESGNSLQLANTLYATLHENGFAPNKSVSLNDLVINTLSKEDTLLIITSSFGDGEPPANAAIFYEKLLVDSPIECQFAVFGLGDVSYPKFCGFSQEVNTLLHQRGAVAMAQRVDADVNYIAFFNQWSKAIVRHFLGDDEPLKKLVLQVTAYNEKQSFLARIQSVERINSSEFPVYDIHIDITDSGISYVAGDLLYVLPPANVGAIERIKKFYGKLSEAQLIVLSTKELRHLGKPLFRAISKITKDKSLKDLTKISAAAQLADYCYGRDVADILTDYCSPEKIEIDTLLDILTEQLPRVYSIASCNKASPNTIRICVREVNYYMNEQSYTGTASHFLASSQAGDNVNIYVRANSHFHLPNNKNVPIILIGAGVGIAPYLGFLSNKRSGESHLFFGERHKEKDFLYGDELNALLNNKQLTNIYTAFSRDQASKIYIQDRICIKGKLIWNLMNQSAEIYVCGSKQKLEKAVDNALLDIAMAHGGMNEKSGKEWLYQLTNEGKYHKDLY